MKQKILFRPLDFMFLAVFAAAAVFSLILLKRSGKGNAVLAITCDSGEYIYPLDKDAEYSIKGPLGNSLITVKDGSASFTDSPCPNKICVQSPPVSKNGDWAACMPNRVFIRVEQEGKSGVDATAF